jgi:hypothetical protein
VEPADAVARTSAGLEGTIGGGIVAGSVHDGVRAVGMASVRERPVTRGVGRRLVWRGVGVAPGAPGAPVWIEMHPPTSPATTSSATTALRRMEGAWYGAERIRPCRPGIRAARFERLFSSGLSTAVRHSSTHGPRSGPHPWTWRNGRPQDVVACPVEQTQDLVVQVLTAVHRRVTIRRLDRGSVGQETPEWRCRPGPVGDAEGKGSP